MPEELTIIVSNSVNLLSGCTLDVDFKGIAEVGRAKEPIDHDEQFPHLGSIIVRKLANCDLGLQPDLLRTLNPTIID
jgi:hypothetical protein